MRTPLSKNTMIVCSTVGFMGLERILLTGCLRERLKGIFDWIISNKGC